MLIGGGRFGRETGRGMEGEMEGGRERDFVRKQSPKGSPCVAGPCKTTQNQHKDNTKTTQERVVSIDRLLFVARTCSSALLTKGGTASLLCRSLAKPDSIQLLRASFLCLLNWSTRTTGCRTDKTSRIPPRGPTRASSRSNRCIRSLSTHEQKG